MKTALCALLSLLCLSALAQPNSEPPGQGAPAAKIWRCGKIYTNSPPAGDKECVKLATRKPEQQLQDYLACQSEASKAPTELGVRVALGVCKQRFGE